MNNSGNTHPATSPELWDKLRQIRWEWLTDLPTAVSDVMLEAADFVEAAMSQPQSPEHQYDIDQSPAGEVENLANEMLQRADELHRGGRIELACEMGKFSRKVRALSAIKPRQTTDDEIERLRELIVELWHESEAGRKDLHHYLGMNWQQYQAWANPSAIRNGDEGMGS